MSSDNESPNASTSPLPEQYVANPVRPVPLPRSVLRNFTSLPSSLQEIDRNIFDRKYQMVKELGKGQYGAVYKVRQKGTDKVFAAKKLFYKTDERQEEMVMRQPQAI